MGYRALAWMVIGAVGLACAGPGDGGLLGEPCRDKKCRDGLKCGGASFECMAKDSCLDSTGKALDGNCAGGQICVTDAEAENFGICLPGGDCSNEFRPERVPPNVMVLLDTTGSMTSELVDGQKKWDAAESALSSIITAFEGQIRFGLAVFSGCACREKCPDGMSESCDCPKGFVSWGAGGTECAVGAIESAISDSTSGIQEYLDSHDREDLCVGSFSNGWESSIGFTLDMLADNTTWRDASRENAVLLISDGEDNCTPGDPSGAAATLLSGSPSARTYVVGFAADTGQTDPEELQATAVAGGTKEYYMATSTAELEQALDSIGGTAALSCTHTLKDNVPPEGTKIYIYFDASVDAIPEDAVDGWTYDPATTTVTLHGASCDKVKSGEVSEVVVSYDCDRGAF